MITKTAFHSNNIKNDIMLVLGTTECSFLRSFIIKVSVIPTTSILRIRAYCRKNDVNNDSLILSFILLPSKKQLRIVV